MEISRMLTISTAHITKETADNLNKDCLPLNPEHCSDHAFCFHIGIAVYPKDDYGWFLWIGPAELSLAPPDLRQCIEFARRHNCEWLCLDCDGLIEGSLQTYEWEE